LALKLLVTCVTLCLIWVITSVIAAQREAKTERAFPPEGRFVTVEGQRLHVVEMGTGPDLILIHGLSGNARDMSFRMGPELAKHTVC